MQLTRTELDNIKALHVTTKIPVYIYDFHFKSLRIYHSAKRYSISYDFSKIESDPSKRNSTVWYEYGIFKEIFIFLRYKDVIIVVGPFLTNHMDEKDMDALMNSRKMMAQSLTHKEECLKY